MSSILDLEEEYISLFLQKINVSINSNPNDINKFIKNIQEEKRILMDFKESIILEWTPPIGEKDMAWLPYYEMRLIQEIRNIKLDKLC